MKVLFLGRVTALAVVFISCAYFCGTWPFRLCFVALALWVLVGGVSWVIKR